jgi:ferredoxin-type protein NapG
MPDESPMDRRRFFRRGLAELFRPIARAVSPLERAAQKISDLDGRVKKVAAASKTSLNVWLRPPGAILEKNLSQTCRRGGECVKACPAHCIKIDSTGTRGGGLPYIEADTSACVVCTGLYCMDVCPSGALVPTAAADIDMGTAVWKEETCVRGKGEDCRICIDQCPLGETAIALKQGDVAVNPLGCIGCGECQHHCPTTPKSIVVIPKAARES